MARLHPQTDPGHQETGVTADAGAAATITGGVSGMKKVSGIETALTAAQWDKVSKNFYTLLYPLPKLGELRQFISQVLIAGTERRRLAASLAGAQGQI